MSSGSKPPVSAIPTGVDLTQSADGLFWGIIISAMLSGQTISQAWTYGSTNRDGPLLRTLVSVITLLGISTTFLNATLFRENFIVRFGNLAQFPLKLAGGQVAEIALSSTVVFLVQLFFASRVYLLSGRKWLPPLFLGFAAACGLIAALYLIIASQLDGNWIILHPNRRHMIGTIFLGGFPTICDVGVTLYLFRFLRQSRPVVKQTKGVLYSLQLYAFSRGLLVAVMQTVTVVIFLASPTHGYWLPVHLCLIQAYIITTLTMLNTRKDLRERYQQAAAAVTINSMFTSPISSPHSPQAFQLSGLSHDPALGSSDARDDVKDFPSMTNGVLVVQERTIRHMD